MFRELYHRCVTNSMIYMLRTRSSRVDAVHHRIRDIIHFSIIYATNSNHRCHEHVANSIIASGRCACLTGVSRNIAPKLYLRKSRTLSSIYTNPIILRGQVEISPPNSIFDISNSIFEFSRTLSSIYANPIILRGQVKISPPNSILEISRTLFSNLHEPYRLYMRTPSSCKGQVEISPPHSILEISRTLSSNQTKSHDLCHFNFTKSVISMSRDVLELTRTLSLNFHELYHQNVTNFIIIMLTIIFVILNLLHLNVSFAEDRLFYSALLQKRLVFLRSLLMHLNVTQLYYGVASISGLLQIIGILCRISSLL